MKHPNPHKLDVACLGCVRMHIEHKNKLLRYVRKIAKDAKKQNIEMIVILARMAQPLLDEIKEDNE